MPSTTPKQARTMAGVAHNPAFARKMGIPQKVGREFNQADKGTGIMSNGYAKGGNVQTAHYAQGGTVLGRTRDFMKEEDEFREGRDPKSGKFLQTETEPEQEYSKTKQAKGTAGRTSKCLTPVKPRT